MAEHDFYETLGVSRSASADAIKKAYKRLAMRHHPDRNKGAPSAEAKFKRIQQAYGVLSDPQKKNMYDTFGTADESSAGAAGDGFSGDSFSDLFNGIFGQFGAGGVDGQQTRRSGPDRGRDLQVRLDLDLEEAARGSKCDVRITALGFCDDCDGSGMTEHSKQTDCPQCRGAGVVRKQMSFVTMQQTCSWCRGAGRKIENPCPSCSGEGRVRKRRTVAVRVPAGVDTGDMLRLSGEGEAGGPSGSSGDLLVSVQIKPNAVFSRDGDNLHCEVPVSFATAALGGKIQVPSLNGSKRITIPKGLQSGQTVRVRGAGIKSVRSSTAGDLLCSIVVETPQNLNAKQEDLLHAFERSVQNNAKRHSPKSETWLDKVKQMLS